MIIDKEYFLKLAQFIPEFIFWLSTRTLIIFCIFFLIAFMYQTPEALEKLDMAGLQIAIANFLKISFVGAVMLGCLKILFPYALEYARERITNAT